MDAIMYPESLKTRPKEVAWLEVAYLWEEKDALVKWPILVTPKSDPSDREYGSGPYSLVRHMPKGSGSRFGPHPLTPLTTIRGADGRNVITTKRPRDTEKR
jgi:hypothetical protein